MLDSQIDDRKLEHECVSKTAHGRRKMHFICHRRLASSFIAKTRDLDRIRRGNGNDGLVTRIGADGGYP